MATGKRKSQPLAAGITSLQYEEALAKYAGNDARICSLGAEMDERITEIRDEYSADLEILGKDNEMLMAVIKGYVTQNKDSLLEKDRRSFETLYGKIGFRMGMPTLKTLRGLKWDDVVVLLKQYAPDYVRTVEEVNKEKLIGDREKEGIGDKLDTLGVKVSQTETFFIDLKKEVLA